MSANEEAVKSALAQAPAHIQKAFLVIEENKKKAAAAAPKKKTTKKSK